MYMIEYFDPHFNHGRIYKHPVEDIYKAYDFIYNFLLKCGYKMRNIKLYKVNKDI